MNMSWGIVPPIVWGLVGWSAPAFAADWVTMHQYQYGADLWEQVSFKPQPAEAALQLKLAGYSDTQAEELEEQLTLYLDDSKDTVSACHPAKSLEGTLYSDLGVNRAGQMPEIVHNQTQRLGVDLPVIECQIKGIHTRVHWFYDKDDYQSFSSIAGPCNNIGVVAKPSPHVAGVPKPTPKPTPPPASKARSDDGNWGVSNVPPLVVHIDDINVCGCVNIPGSTTIVPGSRLQPADLQSNWK